MYECIKIQSYSLLLLNKDTCCQCLNRIYKWFMLRAELKKNNINYFCVSRNLQFISLVAIMADEDYIDDFGGNVSLAQAEGYLDEAFIGPEIFQGLNSPQSQSSQATEAIPSPQQRESVTRIIGGIPVEFPGDPYESQIQMMADIIHSLQTESNSLIESPTGSGKTLAILCAVLAWRKHEYLRDSQAPRKQIFYCTRTHSQGSSIIKELRKTAYTGPDATPRVKVTILGSRDQMCVNDSVISTAAGDGDQGIDDLCDKLKQNLTKNRKNPGEQQLETCQFYKKQSEDYFSNEGNLEIRDIEDLQTAGRTHASCPYFGSKYQLQQADIVICPYNYIISSHVRRNTKIRLQNSIVIFDEGHNLEKALCSEGSMTLSSNLFRDIYAKCNTIKNDPDVSIDVRNACDLFATTFSRLRNWITRFSQNERLPQGLRVIEKLRELGLGQDSLEARLIDWSRTTTAESGPVLNKTTSQRILKVLTVLDYLYKHDPIEDYCLRVERPQQAGSELISMICLKPSVVFQEISRETSSITVTSGTLTPLDSYARELNIPFGAPLSLPQTISNDQYMVAKMAVGPLGKIPDLTYSERYTPRVMQNIGELIVRVCQVVPNGIIVFCPSKDYIQSLLQEWEFPSDTEDEPILDRLRQLKHLVNECDMKDPSRARALLKEYRDKSKEGRGAILFGVHRGKVSEGIDFSDEEARAVINIGIPLAPMKASSVSARKYYFQEVVRNNDLFSEWYDTEAMRAVNQGLGRSVRHRNDWGAIIIVDPRIVFNDEYSNLLPGWIEEASVAYSDADNNEFEQMVADLRQFVNSVTAN